MREIGLSAVHLIASVGRPLCKEEERILRRLTPQGIAKVNTDACRNVPFKDTLEDLKEAFQRIERRREVMPRCCAWPPPLDHFVRQMQRPLRSTEVEMLLKERAIGGTATAYIQEHLRKGDTVEDILEDMDCSWRYFKVAKIAERLTQATSKTVSVTTLARTVRPTAQSTVAEPSLFRGNRICVGVSPVISWFMEEDPPREVAVVPHPKDWAGDEGETVLCRCPSESETCGLSSAESEAEQTDMGQMIGAPVEQTGTVRFSRTPSRGKGTCVTFAEPVVIPRTIPSMLPSVHQDAREEPEVVTSGERSAPLLRGGAACWVYSRLESIASALRVGIATAAWCEG